MADIFPKFIIEKDPDLGYCIIIAKCTYHKQLATNPLTVKGGGWWKLDHDNKIGVLFGKSEDFGKATVEDIKKCIEKKNIYTNSSLSYKKFEDYMFYYKHDSGDIENLN